MVKTKGKLEKSIKTKEKVHNKTTKPIRTKILHV